MDEKQVKKNIKLYLIFEALREPLFWGPIIILYIQRVSGMSLSEVYFMESVVILLQLLLEVPSGALADLIGKKRTIVIGSFLLFADTVVFSLASNRLMIWSADILWSIGFALCSGADSAFLYDTLLSARREKEFNKIHGKANSLRLAAIAICSLGVGFLAEVHIRLPILVCLPFLLVSFGAVLCFVEPVRLNMYGAREHLELMKKGIVFVATHKRVLWVVAFAVMITGVSKLWFFTYNPYFELVELPLGHFGVMFFFMNVIASGSSKWGWQVERAVGRLGVIVLMIFCVSFPIIFMGVKVFQAAVLMTLFQNVARGYFNPFSLQFLNEHLNSESRATVISVKSAIVGGVEFLGLAFFGVLLGLFPLPLCLVGLGTAALLSGIILVFCYLELFR